MPELDHDSVIEILKEDPHAYALYSRLSHHLGCPLSQLLPRVYNDYERKREGGFYDWDTHSIVMTGVNHGSAFRFKRYAINHELRHGLSSLFEKLAYGYRIPNIPRLAAIQATYEPYGYAAKPVQGASYSPLRSSISLGKESITPYMLPLLAANMISDAAQNHVAVSISYAADIALLALGGATAAVIRSKRF